MASKKRGSEAALNEIVKMGGRMRVSEMSAIGEAVKAAGGTLTAVTSDDDDWCGTGTLRLKWPPKQEEFLKLMDLLVERRINFEGLINGIPVPEDIVFRISRQIGR